MMQTAERTRFTEAEMATVRDTDLPDLLSSLGYQVKRIGRYYTTQEMDSIRIKDRRTWFRYSEGIGGDAITFLQRFYNKSLSSNIQLGIRMAMKEGKVNFHYRSMLGYQRGADGKPEIVPEEAEVVRRIYRRYLEGCSEGQIQRELTQDGIATAKGVKAWSHQIVHNILTNEKYAGDALLQKTFTTDCISKKVKKNTGELPQYYIKDNHPAIIPRDIYQRVQEEMARRTSKRKILQKS